MRAKLVRMRGKRPTHLYTSAKVSCSKAIRYYATSQEVNGQLVLILAATVTSSTVDGDLNPSFSSSSSFHPRSSPSITHAPLLSHSYPCEFLVDLMNSCVSQHRGCGLAKLSGRDLCQRSRGEYVLRTSTRCSVISICLAF